MSAWAPRANPFLHFCPLAAGMTVLLGSFGAVRAQEKTRPKAAQETLPRIVANRNLKAAGELRDGVLTVSLEIRGGAWYPDADSGPSLPVQAFAEEGRAPEIPGPMLRVPGGTEFHATIRNLLEKSAALVYGLHQRPGGATEPLEIPPGKAREVQFKVTAPGTYYYWATTTDRPLRRRFGVDSQLSGALIVDPPGEAVADRVFVIGLWVDPGSPGDPGRNAQEILVTNGKSWPYTERLTYEAGQTVRWRWINSTVLDHPMHLHGSYFRVTGQGDGEADVDLPAEKQRQVVTERIDVGETRSFTWLPPREGRWLFHCHILAHMSAEYRYIDPVTLDPAVGMHYAAEDSIGLGGLVLGITVLPGGKATIPAPRAMQPRELTLLVRERPVTDRSQAATVFQLQEGPQAPPLEAATIPGPPLVLTQGEPVEITVVNQLRERTAIHWHGIELESYYDGVPGWGGLGMEITPPIEPGNSFVARFAPPRAGTFIYHTHWHNFLQLTGGLYGPLIVLKPGEKFDPETDKIVVIGLGGPYDFKSPILLNGSAQPEPLRLKAGVKYRLRFINITPNNAGLQVSLVGGGSTSVRWRAVAKDGADLPPAQAIEQEARQVVSVGETYDFEFEPTAKGDLRLEVLRPFNRTWAVVEVQVR